MSGKKARARKQKRERRRDANAGEAIPGLLNDIVVTHVLRSDHFDDPADLARLPAVSRAMRDAVADTGLQFEELKEKRAVNLGCLSAVQRLQRRGCLSRKEYLCEAAARSGQLEKLKALRADDTPWDAGTCLAAASGGHLNVLQWLLANGCQFGERACASAAYRGHLEVLQWLRANGCPWNENTVSMAAGGGHLKVVLWACANGCPCDEKGLHYAAEKGHETAVRALIEAGADVNTVIDDGGTPLFMALRAPIEAGEDVINTTRDNGVTALYVGAQNGRETVVRALFELGADINEARDLGATPLFIGAFQGNEAVVRALIEVGADVNKANDIGGSPLSASTTPISNVARGNHAAIVQLLRDAGAV